MLSKTTFTILLLSLLMYWFVNNRNWEYERRIEFSEDMRDRDVKKVRAIITGATGMIGEGVVHQCLLDDDVESILLVNRRESGIKHPKIKEIIHKDLSNLTSIEDEFKGYNSVFYCLGTSSLGKDKDTYYKISYEMPIAMLNSFIKVNNAKEKYDNDLTFIYVTGAGTDSNSWSNWARVKALTESTIINSTVSNPLAFRPGFVKEIEGLKYTNKYYKFIGWLYKFGRLISTNGFITLEEMGKAMINSVFKKYPSRIVSGIDMAILANSR
ncbi:hypothetical protein DICPUDRAFT_97267 [Dictyostelium purpureum]|uniref:NAD-dependent epimerase/dehydratase domain-containing protein n=1 Tax=Dictyostelium purpureum TaxID=5786 RepID=F0ZF87_DICPU|nr:uncharacterized protein DICPUDRAFT_97267 [Dictyostelium purpureum]EGC37410.1 hypothetical protein DICPUDRAFT_97267 [Dictyostelium purpureum]|eukprot:XP_003286063.1 hypothetical protein DICPUDRAFT_97267 [Dictyostelium purpureum]